MLLHKSLEAFLMSENITVHMVLMSSSRDQRCLSHILRKMKRADSLVSVLSKDKVMKISVDNCY